MKMTIRLLTISKILFVIYLLYSNVFSVLFHVNGLSEALLIIAFVLAMISRRLRFPKNNSLWALLVFAAYILLSAFFVSYNITRAVRSIISFIELLGVFALIIVYCEQDGKIDFVLNAFIVEGLITVLYMFFRGTNAARISISENINVNTIGITLAFSIGFILYFLIEKRNKPFKWFISIAAIAVLLIGIMLTVSKKAIIGGAALIILWIILCYRFTFAKLKLFWKVFIFLGLVAVGIFAYKWYKSNYAQQIEVLIKRMDDLYVGDSDQARLLYIKEGFRIFLTHPFFGVGFNNARYYMPRETYTHCFYSELPACTGIIGTIIFGYALIQPSMMIVKSRKIIKRTDLFLNTRIKYILAFFLVFLAVNLAQISFYSSNLMYVLSVIAGFAVCVSSIEVQPEDSNASH